MRDTHRSLPTLYHCTRHSAILSVTDHRARFSPRASHANVVHSVPVPLSGTVMHARRARLRALRLPVLCQLDLSLSRSRAYYGARWSVAPSTRLRRPDGRKKRAGVGGGKEPKVRLSERRGIYAHRRWTARGGQAEAPSRQGGAWCESVAPSAGHGGYYWRRAARRYSVDRHIEAAFPREEVKRSPAWAHLTFGMRLFWLSVTFPDLRIGFYGR